MDSTGLCGSKLRKHKKRGTAKETLAGKLNPNIMHSSSDEHTKMERKIILTTSQLEYLLL